MRIRQANVHDVGDIARIHVASWKSTYKGMISDDYLSALSIEKRIENWRWVFNHLNPHEVIYVAENADGTLIGFANGGKCRSEEFNKYDSELYAIYILEEYQGKGYGQALFSSIIKHLQSHDYHSLMVWVLERNPATAFYSRLGGQVFSQKDIRIGNETVTELAMGWSDINEGMF